ncbi:MAG: hypothetical protein J6V87_02060 [Prevotella sp.]|nr:hypothetical protein [Prevotella sp.]
MPPDTCYTTWNGVFHKVELVVPWHGTKYSIGWNKSFPWLERPRGAIPKRY